VGAPERKQALYFARGVLDELWIAGSIQTNERFLSELLAHPWVQEGIFHAGFVDEEFLPSVRPPVEIFEAFQMVAAEAAKEGAKATGAAKETVPGSTITWAVGDQVVKTDAKNIAIAKSSWIEGPTHWISDGLPGVSGWVSLADGRKLRACATPVAPNKWQVRLGAWVLPLRRILRYPPGSRPKPAPRLLALVQGRIHAVLYREGTIVPAHEPLVVLDSLGMLVPHAVPVDVRIVRLKKSAEEVVQAGEEIAELEIVSKG